MRSLLSNTSNSISWPIRDEYCCSSPPITAHLDRVRVVGGGDCSTCSSCSCPRRRGHVHLQFFNFLLQKCRSAEYLQSFALLSPKVQSIFSPSRYYLQKCRVSPIPHVIIFKSAEYLQFFTLLSAAEVHNEILGSAIKVDAVQQGWHHINLMSVLDGAAQKLPSSSLLLTAAVTEEPINSCKMLSHFWQTLFISNIWCEGLNIIHNQVALTFEIGEMTSVQLQSSSLPS